jgi:zinc protease
VKQLISTQPKQTLHRRVLDNGITLIVTENFTADLIAGRVFFKNAGTKLESKNKSGISHLVSTLLTKGTQRLSSIEIAQEIESVGANLGADAATDYFLVSLKTVSADFPKMLALLAEIIRYPSFPQTEIDLEKYLTQQSIRSQLEQPFNVAFNQLREAMYQDHPYGMSILGTKESVDQITREDLLNYHENFFRPDNLVISLSGRIHLENAVNLVNQVFADWSIPDRVMPQTNLPQLTVQPCTKITPQDTQQSIVMLGYLTCGVTTGDYSALKLLNTYLGNGLSSRLFVELREKRGLAYDVSAFYPTRLYPSQFVVYMGTAPENTNTALEGLRFEVERLCEKILNPEELQTAKNKLLGQYALGKQTNAEIAQILGWYESLGLGLEFDQQFQDNINQVTPEIAQEVACRYFVAPYISLVGPEAVVGAP